MKLYLTADVKKIGRKGELVSVADGYGRNFLLARGLASVTPVARTAAKQIQTLSTVDHERLKQLTTLQLKVPANEQGTLYQAITATAVREAIRQAIRVTLPPEMIKLSQPIKKLGQHPVSVIEKDAVLATIICEVETA